MGKKARLLRERASTSAPVPGPAGAPVQIPNPAADGARAPVQIPNPAADGAPAAVGAPAADGAPVQIPNPAADGAPAAEGAPATVTVKIPAEGHHLAIKNAIDQYPTTKIIFWLADDERLEDRVVKSIFSEIIKQNSDKGRSDSFPLAELINMDYQGFEKKVASSLKI